MFHPVPRAKGAARSVRTAAGTAQTLRGLISSLARTLPRRSPVTQLRLQRATMFSATWATRASVTVFNDSDVSCSHRWRGGFLGPQRLSLPVLSAALAALPLGDPATARAPVAGALPAADRLPGLEFVRGPSPAGEAREGETAPQSAPTGGLAGTRNGLSSRPIAIEGSWRAPPMGGAASPSRPCDWPRCQTAAGAGLGGRAGRSGANGEEAGGRSRVSAARLPQ